MIPVLASIIIYSFIVLAIVIMIVNYDHIVITIVNYDRKTFIVQATGVIVGELFFTDKEAKYSWVFVPGKFYELGQMLVRKAVA